MAAEAAARVDGEAVRWARGHRDSGAMLRSHFGPRKVGPGRYTFGFAAPHSSYPDTGTRPHVIRPVRARALRFQMGGRTVFARRVNHPGTVGDRGWTQATSPRAWQQHLRAAARTVRV